MSEDVVEAAKKRQDPEIAAMSRIAQAMSTLTPGQRDRVIEWAHNRFSFAEHETVEVGSTVFED